MRRTVKRYSVRINCGKWQQLCRIARLYRDEKNWHLARYNQDAVYASQEDSTDLRDQLIKEKYQPKTGLQARQWKIANKNAYETVQKNWAALATRLKPLIHKHKGKWSDATRHYAFWLLYSEQRLAETISGAAPLPDFAVWYEDRKRVMNYLRRVVRRNRAVRSVAKSARAFELDANMYDVQERDGKQYLAIMTLVPRKRLVIPLTGRTHLRGNLKIVLDFEQQRVEVHVSYRIKVKEVDGAEPVVGLDAGVSEVYTDDLGTHYEPGFGATLSRLSKQTKKTGDGRNRQYRVREKSSRKKAARLQKFNLGKQKLAKRRKKGKVRVRQHISQAIHTMVAERHPAVVVTENLDIRGKARSKEMSRLVSYWMRGALKERMGFLALVEGFHHKQANPAYTSQTCPTCLFVDPGNRSGDVFQCLYCGHRDDVDRVAANNLKTRLNDHEITLYTPKAVVKAILLKRFNDSLEKRGLPPFTVSVRTGGERRACRQSETPCRPIML